MSSQIYKILLLTFFVFTNLVNASAHSGGKNLNGCHIDTSNNTSHCHNDENTIFERHPIKIRKVVDGDTVHLSKPIHGVSTIRLDAIDTPEIFSSSCEREKEIGEIAKIFAQDLFEGKKVVAITSGKKDKFGRLIARLEVDGQDYGQIMLGKGLAVRYNKSWIDTPKAERWCN